MADKFRFACLVSGQGRLMQTVANACAVMDLPFEIAVVIADRMNGAFTRASEAGIETMVIDHKTYHNREAFDQALLKGMQTAAVDGAMLTFDRLVGPALLTHYSDRILNTHFSLLPLFPGFGAIASAVSSGMRFAGATIHMVDETMDSGAIVAQVAVPIEPDITVQTLGDRLFRAVAPMHLQAMSWLAEGRLRHRGGKRLDITGGRYEPGRYSPSLEPPFDRFPEHLIVME